MQETQEMQVRSLGHEDPLEEEMTTQSSILAWKILRTKAPGRPQSMGSQKSQTRMKQLSTHACIYIYIYIYTHLYLFFHFILAVRTLLESQSNIY